MASMPACFISAGVSIRLPKGERNDVDALVLQLTGFAGHGNGCGFAKTLKEGGCGLFHVG